MSNPLQKVERVEDTAHWVAMARALESERKDALFRDPLARRLAGEVGARLVAQLSGRATGTWPIVARTQMMDAHVLRAVADGADAVLNLAAGLDTRPYRMDLPAKLVWLEADQPAVISYKESSLAAETPRCAVERVAVDLARAEERQALFGKVATRFKRVFVITEGLLCYLPEEAALGIARDLRATPSVFRWMCDLPNAAVLKFVAKRTKGALQGTATMQFGPDNGPKVFESLGWKILEAASIFKTAGKLKRLPFPMSLFARLPEAPYGKPGRPWSGVCVLEPQSTT
jgi:methyltransferase (TIGR00027 family)